MTASKKSVNNMEIFPIVDTEGNTIGKATRGECHSGSMILHPVVHLHVFSNNGEIYLQKRAMTKDIQPGKWDTAVGGHIDYGEDVETALLRESREELGITGIVPTKIKSYVFQSDIERELINTYYIKVDADEFAPKIDPVEIDEGKFWKIEDVMENLDKNVFTPNFVQEFRQIKDLIPEK
jgi:isopentenyldiphosphate isomerase